LFYAAWRNGHPGLIWIFIPICPGRPWAQQRRPVICAAEGVDHVRYLMRLTEQEMIDRERRMIERRIRLARFPIVKNLDSFDFKAIPSLNKMQVLELARCDYIDQRENIIAVRSFCR
jgi:DNA replication protein DnaC